MRLVKATTSLIRFSTSRVHDRARHILCSVLTITYHPVRELLLITPLSNYNVRTPLWNFRIAGASMWYKTSTIYAGLSQQAGLPLHMKLWANQHRSTGLGNGIAHFKHHACLKKSEIKRQSSMRSDPTSRHKRRRLTPECRSAAIQSRQQHLVARPVKALKQHQCKRNWSLQWEAVCLAAKQVRLNRCTFLIVLDCLYHGRRDLSNAELHGYQRGFISLRNPVL